MSKEFIAFAAVALGIFGLIHPRVCFGIMVMVGIVFLAVERFIAG